MPLLMPYCALFNQQKRRKDKIQTETKKSNECKMIYISKQDWCLNETSVNSKWKVISIPPGSDCGLKNTAKNAAH